MVLRTVKPGELITAADWNDLVTAVGALDGRIVVLESGGSKIPPRITQVLPTGTRTVGDEIRIYGSNFGFTQGAHSVFFGDTRAIQFLTGSSDTLLIVKIPDPVKDATTDGTPLTMSVGNLHGYTTWVITIKSKPVVVTGGFQFTYQGSNPTTPTENASILYSFELHSTASEDLNVSIAPNLQIIQLPPGFPDPGLSGLLTVLDADGNERPDRMIALAEGTTKTISLRLKLPDKTDGVKYSLSVTASATGVASEVEALPDQQVGHAGEQPDPTVSVFEFSSIIEGQGSFSTDTGGLSGIKGTLRVKQGTTVTFDMDTSFTGIPVGTTNKYKVTAKVRTPVNGWTASVNPIMGNPLEIHGPGGSIDSYFDITAPASANTAVVQLMLTRQGVTTDNKRTASYRLLTSP